jgi:hypothetical protein
LEKESNRSRFYDKHAEVGFIPSMPGRIVSGAQFKPWWTATISLEAEPANAAITPDGTHPVDHARAVTICAWLYVQMYVDAQSGESAAGS